MGNDQASKPAAKSQRNERRMERDSPRKRDRDKLLTNAWSPRGDSAPKVKPRRNPDMAVVAWAPSSAALPWLSASVSGKSESPPSLRTKAEFEPMCNVTPLLKETSSHWARTGSTTSSQRPPRTATCKTKPGEDADPWQIAIVLPLKARGMWRSRISCKMGSSCEHKRSPEKTSHTSMSHKSRGLPTLKPSVARVLPSIENVTSFSDRRKRDMPLPKYRSNWGAAPGTAR
mmetsp:Transcript_118760/g.340918  ORF Transcript_118760/g.340918 Transcript_118760/m.340918 type:complete len:230 (+) Transcript_118760:116-805(+)